MTDLKAFLEGYKPAFLYNHHMKKPWFYEDEEVLALKAYPKVEGIDLHRMKDMTLYLQDTAKKEDFLHHITGLEKDSLSYHRQVGIALGYPPIAADFYARSLKDSSLDCEKVGFYFYGIGFVGGIHDIEECTEWLWNTYPKHFFTVRKMEISYKLLGSQEIEFKDYTSLNRLAKQIKEAMTTV